MHGPVGSEGVYMAATEDATALWPSAASRELERLAGGRPWWRDALRRRMLACADAGAVVVFSVSSALILHDGIVTAFWVGALLQIRIDIAKLHGLFVRT